MPSSRAGLQHDEKKAKGADLPIQQVVALQHTEE